MDKTDYQVRHINTYLIGFFQIHVNREFRETIKKFDPTVHSLEPFIPYDAKALPNPHNDTTTSVYVY